VAKTLAAQGIEDAHLEAELLLRHVLGLDRTELYINIKRKLSPEQVSRFSNLAERRLQYEPAAYICGHKEFFDIDLEVNPHVLIPRPETETLVEKAIALAGTTLPRPCLAADIGTGCGAIAIALALNASRIKIYATDISTNSLEIAKRNCELHGVADRITMLHGDLLNPLPQPVHLILANLPYVRESDQLSPEISKFEPVLALNGGIDGLEVISRLLPQAKEKLLPGGILLLEIGCDQGQKALKLAQEHYPKAMVSITLDLSGHDRILYIETDK